MGEGGGGKQNLIFGRWRRACNRRGGVHKPGGETAELSGWGGGGVRGSKGGPHLHDRVSNSRHALIEGLSDDGKAPGIGAHQSGKVSHKVNGGEVISVGDFQSLQKGGQPIIAEAQCLACSHKVNGLQGCC